MVSYTYDAWGNPTSCTGSLAGIIGQKNPFRCRGYYYDTESGLYYTASRYYDPEAGRFLSPDALDTLTASPSSLTDKNLYAYCDNNPVMRQDSSGEFWSLIKGVVCAAVNVTTTVISSIATGQEVGIGDIAVAALSGAACGLDRYAALASGIVNGVDTFVSSLVNGASLKGAIFSGTVAGVSSFASMSNIAGLAAGGIDLPTTAALDSTFGLAGNAVSAVVHKTVMEDSKPSKASKKNSSNKNISKTKTSQGTSKNTKRKRRLHRYTYTAYTRDGRKIKRVGYYYF